MEFGKIALTASVAGLLLLLAFLTAYLIAPVMMGDDRCRGIRLVAAAVVTAIAVTIMLSI